MRVIRWSVDHPAAVAAFYIVVVSLAVLALLRLIPVRMMPRLESPLLGVVTRLDGLQVEEVERVLSTPLERALAQVTGVRFVRSTSMPGMSLVTLEFPYGSDMVRAAQEASAQLAALQLEVEPDQAPRVQSFDPLHLPVLRLALRSPGVSLEDLRKRVDATMLTRLQAVPGVESVYAVGGEAASLELEVDRAGLAARGLSLADLERALKGAQGDQSGGGEGGPSALRVLQGQDPLEVVLRPGLRMREVARLSRAGSHQAVSHTGSLYRLNGQPAVELNVLQHPDASSPQTVAGVRAELERLRAENPGLEIEEAYNDSHFVEAMVGSLGMDLGLAVLLTGLVLFLFLGDLRGTLIALVTVPTSLACAILLFVPLGLSLDSSSLVGLLLAIGRLVDDSILDLHAVQRHLALGKSPREAALAGCSEVRRAVLGATLLICLGVLPLTVCGGLTQAMLAGIVWPFLLSLAASLLVALTLTPLLASRFCRKPSRPAPLSLWLERGYRRCLVWSLRHPGVILSAAAGLCYAAFMMFPLIGSEMMPMSDSGRAYAVLQAQPGTSAEETARLAGAFEQILLRHREVLKVSTEIGGNASLPNLTGYGLGDATSVSMWITLSDKDQRQASLWQLIDAVRSEGLATIPGLRRLSIKEMGADLMASAMAPVEVVIHGPELQRLAWLAERTQELAQNLPGLVQTDTAWKLDRPHWQLRVDPARAAELGLSGAALAEQTRWALDGIRIGNPPLKLSYQDSPIADPGDLLVAGVPLRTLGKLERVLGPAMIMHDNLRRSNSVSAAYRPGQGGSMELTMQLMMNSAMGLPYPPGYGIEQRGDMSLMMDSFQRLLVGLGLSLVLIYLALVAGLRSAVVPLVLMAAIPLELAGVFGALLLCHQTFSTVSLLGIVVLSGMDMTASVLLVDRFQRRGRSPLRAVLEAGPSRLSAILMTVAVTLATMAPLAFFPSTGVDAYSPLAVVVIGGLAVGTPLSLLVVPVLYVAFAARPARGVFRSGGSRAEILLKRS